MSSDWHCVNCWHSGPLTIHGHCERCGSDAVMIFPGSAGVAVGVGEERLAGSISSPFQVTV